jgi:hypothetical protein
MFQFSCEGIAASEAEDSSGQQKTIALLSIIHYQMGCNYRADHGI